MEIYDDESNDSYEEEQYRVDNRPSYIAINHHFIEGINKWLNKKKINKDHVVEVCAGSGLLGMTYLALDDKNVTDSHCWEKGGYDIALDEEWKIFASGVTEESAVGTIRSKDKIDVLIMAMPPKDDTAFHAALVLKKKHPKAKIIYIGTETPSFDGTSEFFYHLEDLEDPDFSDLVAKRYPDEISEFQQRTDEVRPIADSISPYLKVFEYCTDSECACNVPHHHGIKL
ncbi:hypothetical protein [Pseudalkalibacillus hwajinpoensis]|uniref:hypothetical protein n=1 Tax=Guptibacillus hwajinpoensis TaxID=208199 RepID=UPI001CD44BD2|nr:hypothetical protein [Pseudalkalibacillus hwajinpoensis]MCA0991400.1 hypothetical protein [Pseudalkalibacillus hwajinpoensis]